MRTIAAAVCGSLLHSCENSVKTTRNAWERYKSKLLESWFEKIDEPISAVDACAFADNDWSTLSKTCAARAILDVGSTTSDVSTFARSPIEALPRLGEVSRLQYADQTSFRHWTECSSATTENSVLFSFVVGNFATNLNFSCSDDMPENDML